MTQRRRPALHFFLELVVIVVGILLSLLISNWYENYRGSQRETAYLKQLQQDIEADLAQLDSDLEQRKEQLTATEGVMKALGEAPSPQNMAAAVGGLRKLVSTVRFSPIDATFRTLETTGHLELIDNPLIVSGLINLYINTYANLEHNNDDITYFRNEFLLPFMLEKFDFNAALRRGSPLQLTPGEFTGMANLLIYENTSLQSTVAAYDRAREKTSEMLTLITTELE